MSAQPIALLHPDEKRIRALTGVRSLLEYLGEDPSREGLKDTPNRVVKAWTEMTVGYTQDPAQILATSFSEGNGDSMVIVNGIDFQSTCEHHLLPFIGTAAVAYIPAGGKVVGLSKIPRLVECYARRLQIQERLTEQVAEAMHYHVSPDVAVKVTSKHFCCVCRGVRKPNVDMTTTALRGKFLKEAEVRAEFLSLLK